MKWPKLPQNIGILLIQNAYREFADWYLRQHLPGSAGLLVVPGYELLQECQGSPGVSPDLVGLGSNFTFRAGVCDMQIPQSNGNYPSPRAVFDTWGFWPDPLGVGQDYFTNWRFHSFWSLVDSNVAFNNPPYYATTPGTPRMAPVPVKVPSVTSWLDPNQLSPGVTPQPHPAKIPWSMIPNRVINSYRVPGERTEFGPLPPPRPSANQGGHPATPGTEIVWEIPTNGKPAVPTPRPQPHRPRPPGKGGKERKFVLALGRGVVASIINWVGEGVDYLEVVHDALPKKFQAKPTPGNRQPTPQAMAAAVYRHYDKIRAKELVTGLIENELEDRFYGTIGQINAKASRRKGSPGGFQLGLAH